MSPNITNSDLRIDSHFIKNIITDLANKIDILKWDIGAISSRDHSVQVDHGESKQLKGSLKNNITIRVWNKDNKLGITSTSDISEHGIKKAFEGAFEASHFGSYTDIPQFSQFANKRLPLKDNRISSSVGIKRLLEILIKAEDNLINTHKFINSVPYNALSETNVERLYINSDNAFRHMQITQATLFLYAKAEEIGKKPRSSGSVRFSPGVDDLDINGCISESSNKTISHIDYAPIKTDKYLICFSPEAFIDLLGSFSSMFNARSILDGISITDIDNLGKDISVPFLSLSDEALHKDNISTFTFDGEGTPKTNLELIKDGKLVNLLHSEATARKFGVNPTGHATLGAKASVSPEWFVIKKSNTSLCTMNELSHKTTNKKFVLIDELNALHAGVKASQGSFSLPFDGWLIDNGSKKSIESATVAGDIKYLLNNIVQIEDEQLVTASGISPYVWVDNLSITGEG